MFNSLELTGRAVTHVTDVPGLRCALHAGTASALVTLAAAAREEGIELLVASGFRDFERQVALWNGKFLGERALLDRHGRELDRSGLDEPALIEAILNWSALPGASRHHWGTDVDVVDAAAVPDGYRPRLVAEEFAERGVFAKLDRWLATNMHRFGFFRPYSSERGGVLPEPWHLSYAPASVPALEALTEAVLAEAIGPSRMCGKESVLARLSQIHARYVKAVDAP